MPYSADFGWYDDGSVTAPTWESSAGGDYRRINRMVDINLGALFGGDYISSMALRTDAGPNYYGGAGAAHQYDYQKKNADGTWSYVNPGEHNEEAGYFWAGVNSPQYVQALQKSAEQQTALDKARLASPAAVGMAATRSEASLTGGSNEDNLRQELAHYTVMNPGLLNGVAEASTPGMQVAIQQQLKDSSAEAQSSRAEASSGLFGLGDLGTLLLLGGGAALLGPAGAGLWGAEAAGAGALGAEAAGGLGIGELGFIDAIGSGVGAGSSITGALGAAGAGSGAMDLNSLFPDFTNYTGEMTSLPGLEQSLTQVPLDLSTTAIQSQLAANPGLLDTITNLFKTNPTQAANAVKALASGTGTGSGSLLGAGLGALTGLLGGSKQAGTTDTTQTPWGPQQPYLLDAFAKAKAASEGTNPLQTQANANFQSVLSGPTVNPMLGMDNPYLTKAIDNANADVTRAMMPAMTQANRAAGSFGNSGVADIYSKNMTDAYSRNANDMRFKDYTNQQQLQQSAVGNTLGFTTGASAFNAAPTQEYAKTIQGNYGGTTSSPYFTNPTSSMLGGATLGYNLFGGK